MINSTALRFYDIIKWNKRIVFTKLKTQLPVSYMPANYTTVM